MRLRYLITAAFLAAVATLVIAQPSTAESKPRLVTVKPAKLSAGGVIYRVRAGGRVRVRNAKLILNRPQGKIVRRAALRKVRSGLRRGQVRLHLPRAHRRVLIKLRRVEIRRRIRERRRNARSRPVAVSRNSAPQARPERSVQRSSSKRTKPALPRLVIAVEEEEGREATPAPPKPKSEPTSSGSCGAKFGSFGGGSYPDACWRPYSDSSTFNTPVPTSPKLAGNSDGIVNQLLAWGKTQNLLGGHSGESDYGHPIFYSRPSDPIYEIRCLEWASSCEVHGEKVRIPAGARPAGGGDGHLAVIDQQSGVEYDFWQVRSIPSGGGTVSISHGGMTRIDGDGSGSNATAAHFGLAAGIIRGGEVLAGEINHALFAQVKCSSGGSVYPAAPKTSGASCSQYGISTQNAPSMGTRLWLAMSPGQIQALAVPSWKKTILTAMARYGVIVGDTMGGNSSWGLQAESGEAFTSLGLEDPWDAVGRQARLSSYEGGYVFDIHSGVDWARYLKVLDPCVSQGTC